MDIRFKGCHLLWRSHPGKVPETNIYSHFRPKTQGESNYVDGEFLRVDGSAALIAGSASSAMLPLVSPVPGLPKSSSFNLLLGWYIDGFWDSASLPVRIETGISERTDVALLQVFDFLVCFD
jgi:hypothetical protein